MPNCNSKPLNFSPIGRKKIIGSFSGGAITSDGGLLLLREIDKKYKITNKLNSLIYDKRDPLYITHTQSSMLRQRIYAIAANYEDLNDHDYLRHDPAFQLIVNKEDDLASSPTLSRLENRVTRADCVAMKFRVLLSAYAYVLMSKLRNEMLSNTKFENAYCSTLRSNLLKIGAIVIKNTRRIRFLFSSHFTQQELFTDIVSRLVPS